MKMRFLLAASLLGSVGFAAEARPQPDFLAFKPAAQPFGLVDAERLASVEFRRLYGACGMTIFKERRFEAWIFETRIGYAGVQGPDLVVFSTAPGRSRGTRRALAFAGAPVGPSAPGSAISRMPRPSRAPRASPSIHPTE